MVLKSESERHSLSALTKTINTLVTASANAASRLLLINYILGAGIIGMPYAIRMSGIITGTLLLILVSWMTDKSLRMLVDMANYHPKLRKLNVHTYEDLASYAFGTMGSCFILFNMFVLAYGAMVAYLIIIKDTIPTIIGFDNGWEPEVILIMTSLVIIVPLAMKKDMSSLAFTSLLSITVDVVLLFFIVLYSPIKATVSEAGGLGEVLKDEWNKPLTCFIGLGVLSDAMTCQHVAFLIGGSFANRTRGRWATVTFRSIFIVATATGVIGICGYLGFLDETQGDILNNFDPESLVANAARSLLAVTMFFTYPMECFVARHVLVKIMHNGDEDGGEAFAEAVDDNSLPGWKCFGRRQLWTLVIFFLSLLPALVFDDIGPVLSVVGSLGASCVAYVAPGLVFLGVNGEDFLEMVTSSLQSRQPKLSGGAQDELPVEGDAKAELQSGLMSSSYKQLSKPWWWYPLLMPIWCGIASTGSTTLRQKMAESGVDFDAPSEGPKKEDTEDEPSATPRDFCVAVFFIVFGCVAVVAGLASNLVEQLTVYYEYQQE